MTFSYRGEPARARAVRDRAPVRALVRRRARPRPRRAGEPSGSTGSRARRTVGPAEGSSPRPASTPATSSVDDPLTYGDEQPIDGARAGGRDASGAGRRRSSARTRWWSGATTARSWSRSPVVNREAFRTWVLDLLDHAGGARTPGAAGRVRRLAHGARGRAGRRVSERREPGLADANGSRRAAEPSLATATRRAAGRSPGRAQAGKVSPRRSRGRVARWRSCRRARPPGRHARRARRAVPRRSSARSSRTSSCCRCAGCRRTPPTGSSTCG